MQDCKKLLQIRSGQPERHIRPVSWCWHRINSWRQAYRCQRWPVWQQLQSTGILEPERLGSSSHSAFGKPEPSAHRCSITGHRTDLRFPLRRIDRRLPRLSRSAWHLPEVMSEEQMPLDFLTKMARQMADSRLVAGDTHFLHQTVINAISGMTLLLGTAIQTVTDKITHILCQSGFCPTVVLAFPGHTITVTIFFDGIPGDLQKSCNLPLTHAL